jgi:hypothetical protein
MCGTRRQCTPWPVLPRKAMGTTHSHGPRATEADGSKRGGQELLRLRAAGGVEREGEDGTAEMFALPWRGEETAGK